MVYAVFVHFEHILQFQSYPVFTGVSVYGYVYTLYVYAGPPVFHVFNNPTKHKVLKSTAGAVQQSASKSKSSVKAREGQTLAIFCDRSTTWCCLCLCKWLHWKQRLADCSGFACVTSKLG